VKKFGVPAVVAINRFIKDSDAELAAIQEFTKSLGVDAVVCEHWANGSEGTEELANKVVGLIDAGGAKFKPLYDDKLPLFDKIDLICKEIYGASGAVVDKKVRDQLKQWEADGYGHFPVCMAKTQYSFSTDPNLRGAPDGHEVQVREVRLSAGAGFVVAICGEIMTMPGLPRVPSANTIKLDEAGLIQGLF